MKKALLLPLAVFAAWMAACDKAPEPEATPQIKATPVQNAPKISPMPIQPLTSTPSVPQTAPLPEIVKPPPAETGTAARKPSVSSTGASSGQASVSGTGEAPPVTSGS